MRKIINSRNAITEDQCAGEYTEPLHMIDLDSGGFVGVYEPDPNVIIDLLVNNAKGNYSGNITGMCLVNYLMFAHVVLLFKDNFKSYLELP